MQIYQSNYNSNLFSKMAPAATWLLIALWSYAVFIKLADFQLYAKQMRQQVFTPQVAACLVYVILTLETLTLICLIIENLKRLGLIISLCLLSGFTVYVCLIISGNFAKVPCSCGGLISKMSWENHLWFNLFFILLNGFALIIHRKAERRLKAQHQI